jgi:hypothetical protein
MQLHRAGFVLVTLLALVLIPSAWSGTTITTVVRTPITGIFTTGCSAPETVAFTGTYRSVVHYTLDGQGTAHFSAATQMHGVATGLLTGASYQFAGASSSSTVEAPGSLPYHNNFTNTFLLLSQGPQENLRMHVVLHVTVTPAGVMTAEVVQTRLDCVG